MNRRYPYASAGQVASPIVAIVAVIAGILSARLVAGSPPAEVNAVVWGVFGALAAYLVFASEGPQQRPESVRQAAAADGVVACLVTGIAGIVIDLIAASGAGSSSTGTVSVGEVALAALVIIVGGGTIGAASGALALAVGGQDRFERRPASKRKATRVVKSGGSAHAAKKRNRRSR